MTNRILAIGIFAATIVFVAISWLQSGGIERERISSAKTPDEAVRLMLSRIKSHDWNAAYAQLANSTYVDKDDFVHTFAGDYGSLRTYASLENYNVWPLHSNGRVASVRAKLHYSTAVGPLDDVRDIQVEQQGDEWKVVWPTAPSAKLAPQVIPVDYLRWFVINRTSADDWGVQNVDSPRVRIISMNAVQRPDRIVIVGEIVNEDTVPAYVDVNATLLGSSGNPLTDENSFDKISHTLLPKQVSPYRIDFPGYRLEQVKSVRMDAKSMLVPATADPVIEVTQQKLEKDPLGKMVLSGDLVDQSGEIVNIPHILASYYDANGKVIWVSDGYVDQALLPQIPVGFAVDLPADIASKVHTYHVVVNYFVDQNS
jgi:hypothetical protein